MKNMNKFWTAIDFMFAGFDIAWFIVYSNPLSLIALILCLIGGIINLNDL